MVALSRHGDREAAARGELTAELVEALAGGAEIAAYGRQDDCLRRLYGADGRLVRLARRAALADGTGDGLRLAITGATVAGVLAVAISAHASGGLSRVSIALLALLALAAFEAVQPLPEAARELGETLAAGRRLLELTDREPSVTDPVRAALAPSRSRSRSRSKGFAPVTRPASRRRSTASPCGSILGGELRSLGRAGRGRRRSRTCCCAFSIPSTAESRWLATICAPTVRRTCAP